MRTRDPYTPFLATLAAAVLALATPALAAAPVAGSPTLTELQKLVPGPGAPGEEFGTSVAVDGDTAVVGAPGIESVYVLRRVGGTWEFEQKLTDGASADQGANFGSAVDIDGDRIAIGCPNAVNGGKVRLFQRTGSSWTSGPTLYPADPEPGLNFGVSVALDGIYLAIGAPNDTNDGGQLGQTYLLNGSCYLFERNSQGGWFQRMKLIGDQPHDFEFAGRKVAISNETVIVASSGEAYVFVKNSDDVLPWIQQARLTPFDGGGGYARSVAIDGIRCVVGSSSAQGAAPGTGAAYIYVRSGFQWSLEQKVHALDGSQSDGFGESVALEGITLAVGALGDDSGASNSGSTYVFTISTFWTQRARLADPAGAADDKLGTAIALSGTTLLTASQEADGLLQRSGKVLAFAGSGASWTLSQVLEGVNVDEGDTLGSALAISGDLALVGSRGDGDRGQAAGAVYAYDFDGSAWNLTGKLTRGSAANALDFLGHSLAMQGARAVVGAPSHVSEGPGAAFVLERVGPDWLFEETIAAPGGVAGDGFGTAVALAGDEILIGAPSASAFGAPSGLAYLYERSGTAWVLAQTLSAPDGAAGDRFGDSLALVGDRMVVGAPQDDGQASDSGSAYAFRRAGSVWVLEEKLESSAANGARFGQAVATDGTRVAVGAPFDSSVATTGGKVEIHAPVGAPGAGYLLEAEILGEGILATLGGALAFEGDRLVAGGHFASGVANQSGAAFVYQRSGPLWGRVAKLVASDGEGGDHFGSSVAASGERALIGAPLNDQRGAGYVFGTASAPGIAFGFGDGSGNPCPCGNTSLPGAGGGCANSGGAGAVLASSGTSSLGADDLLLEHTTLPGKPVILFCGTQPLLGAPFGDGQRVAGGQTRRFAVRVSDPAGEAEWGPGLGALAGFDAGSTRYFQAWYRDPSGPCGSGFNLSNGVALTFEP